MPVEKPVEKSGTDLLPAPSKWCLKNALMEYLVRHSDTVIQASLFQEGITFIASGN